MKTQQKVQNCLKLNFIAVSTKNNTNKWLYLGQILLQSELSAINLKKSLIKITIFQLPKILKESTKAQIEGLDIHHFVKSALDFESKCEF